MLQYQHINGTLETLQNVVLWRTAVTHTILRRPAVEGRTGLSRSTIYRLIPLGKFPAPIRLGENSVGWLEEAVQQWINQRIKESCQNTKAA